MEENTKLLILLVFGLGTIAVMIFSMYIIPTQTKVQLNIKGNFTFDENMTLEDMEIYEINIETDVNTPTIWASVIHQEVTDTARISWFDKK